MSKQVFWVVEGIIREGALEALTTLMHEMVTSTQANEPGTMAYEWFILPDKTQICIYERYADSPAAMKHLETFGVRFAERFEERVRIDRVTVFGDASEEVMKALGDEGTAFLSPLAGFTR